MSSESLLRQSYCEESIIANRIYVLTSFICLHHKKVGLEMPDQLDTSPVFSKCFLCQQSLNESLLDENKLGVLILFLSLYLPAHHKGICFS